MIVAQLLPKLTFYLHSGPRHCPYSCPAPPGAWPACFWEEASSLLTPAPAPPKVSPRRKPQNPSSSRQSCVPVPPPQRGSRPSCVQVGKGAAHRRGKNGAKGGSFL